MRFGLIIISLVATSLALSINPQAKFYTLQIRSKINTLNNLYLSSKNGKVGAFPGTREEASSAAKFYITRYAGSQTESLHFDDDISQISLRGKNGLLNLVDIPNPSAQNVDFSVPTEWSVFTIGADNALGVKDNSDIPSRKWVAYVDTDGVYYVALWDGFTKQARQVEEVQIIATPAQPPTPL